MSIADHFEQAPDASYMREFSRSNARRQLNLSLVLLAVILAASVGIGLVVRFDQPGAVVGANAPDMAPIAQAAPPSYVGKL